MGVKPMMAPGRTGAGARRKNWLARLAARREASVFCMFVLVFVGLAFASEFFFTTRNLFNVGRQISVVGIVALGESLVIISAGIDLSVGAVIGLAAVLAAMAANAAGSPLLGVLAALFTGALAGALNGALITLVRINPFITTLGMLSICRGVALLVTSGSPQPFDNWAAWFGGGHIAKVPVQFILLLLLSLIFWVFATRTRWGRNIYAVGDNARAAHLAGIDVRATRMIVYTLAGTLAGLGGLLLSGMLANANPNFGTGYELDVIAAAILGGTALTGGRGSVPGVLIGAGLMGLLRNAFVLLGVSGYWQTITIGLVVLVAVGADSWKKGRNEF